MSGTTPNLGISEIPDNSNQPNVVANTALEWLDTALTDEISVSVAGGTDVTASVPAVLKTASIKLTGALTASINYILPTNKKWYRIYNTTTGGSYTVTVKCSGGTGVTFAQGDKRLVYCNGTDVFTLENVYELLANKDGVNGYAGLDGSGLLKLAEFPTAIVQWVSAPANHSSAGTAGQAAYDGTYLYVCYATNSWARIAWSSTAF